MLERNENILWQVDSEWSEKRIDDSYFDRITRALSLFEREKTELLSIDEYTFLNEMGLVKTNGDYNGSFKSSWQIVQLEKTIINELLSIANHIKEENWSALESLKAPYIEEVLKETPYQLQKMQKFGL